MEKIEKKFGDKYSIVKQLGKGGMGAVYLGLDTKLKRQVAIKELILNDNIEENLKKRLIKDFRKEAVAIARLNHENIVNVFDMGSDNENSHYIVMELLDGKALSDIIKFHPLSPEMIINIILQISSALSYVNRNGVVHRDVKPDNIILSGRGSAKLTDFGIAKHSDEESFEHQNEGDFIGTILYMSPEQINDPDGVDERADLYSLAATLYQLLTGQPPFVGSDIREVMIKILMKMPKPPSSINPSLPKELDNVLLKALSKDKDDRQKDIASFEKELRSLTKYKDSIKDREMVFGSPTTISNNQELTQKNINTNTINKNSLENITTSTNINVQNNEAINNENNSNIQNKNINKINEIQHLSENEIIELNMASLAWIDQLDEIYKEESEIKNETSVFLESLKYIVPEINSGQLQNLIKELSINKSDNTIKFLSLFDGIKTLKDIFEENLKSDFLDFLLKATEKGLLPEDVSKIVKSLDFVVKQPLETKEFLAIIKKFSKPSEIIEFISLIDNKKTINDIINIKYSIDELKDIFEFLFELHNNNVINIRVINKKTSKILIGEMFTGFSLVTTAQLNIALKKQSEFKKLVGEILNDMGYLSKENINEVVKYQNWYKQFF